MPKSINRLSDRRARTAPIGLWPDGGGLYLQVTAGADGATRRSWLYRFTINGRERWMGLGSLADVSLAEARQKAGEARRQRAEGIDPIEARATQRALRGAAAMTFDQCCEGYVVAHRAGWSTDHERVWKASIRDYVTPAFGKLLAKAIDTALVLKVLEPIWTTKHETARRLRARIESVLDWARARGHRDGENPARWKGHLSELLPKSTDVHSVKHHAAMPYGEVPALIMKLRDRDDRDARALELLILTVARVGAIVGGKGRGVRFSLWPMDHSSSTDEAAGKAEGAAFQGSVSGSGCSGGEAGEPSRRHVVSQRLR